VSFIGLVDASYLTAKHYSGGSVTCSILNGCDEVLNSEYAVIYKIPLALLGAFYYLIVFGLGSVFLFYKQKGLEKYLLFLTSVGFIFSLWLVYLQVFIIKSLCLYCLVSAFLSITLFVLASRLYLKRWLYFGSGV